MNTTPTTTFEVVATLDWSDTRPIRSRYETLAEALAVADAYRAVGFCARTYLVGSAAR